MKITDSTSTKVGGVTLGDHLLAELKGHQGRSKTAAELLDPILKVDAYEVVIKTGVPTATSAKRVTINPDQTKASGATKSDELKEFVESTLFELTNAKNSETFAALETAIKTGAKGVRTYGREKADLEAEASWNLARILKDQPAYTPSDFGKGHVDACANYKTLDEFKVYFRSEPHERDKQKQPVKGEAGLPSEEYYALLGSYTVGGGKDVMDKLFATLQYNKQYLSLEKLKTLAFGANASEINTKNRKAVTYYHVMIDLLKSAPSPPWSLQWKGGVTAKDCEFTDQMKKVHPDTGEQMKKTIEGFLKTPAKVKGALSPKK